MFVWVYVWILLFSTDQRAYPFCQYYTDLITMMIILNFKMADNGFFKKFHKKSKLWNINNNTMLSFWILKYKFIKRKRKILNN